MCVGVVVGAGACVRACVYACVYVCVCVKGGCSFWGMCMYCVLCVRWHLGGGRILACQPGLWDLWSYLCRISGLSEFLCCLGILGWMPGILGGRDSGWDRVSGILKSVRAVGFLAEGSGVLLCIRVLLSVGFLLCVGFLLGVGVLLGVGILLAFLGCVCFLDLLAYRWCTS